MESFGEKKEDLRYKKEELTRAKSEGEELKEGSLGTIDKKDLQHFKDTSNLEEKKESLEEGLDKGEAFKEGELEREEQEEEENLEFKTGEAGEKLEQEIQHIKEEQDKHAMGFRDVETRKLNQEMQARSRDHDLVKEAEQQEDVVTSTGANLEKFK